MTRAIVDPAALELTERLRGQARDALTRALGPGADRCALLDFPRHRNSGDSAIWLGERALLGEAGVEVVATAERQSYSPRRLVKRLAGAPVLIHGGGNFGDLYPGHHHLRERIFRDLRGHRIVQLAQSVYFRDDAAIERTAKLIADHGDVTILVRDRRSLDLVQERFAATVELCPDFAFGLGPLERPAPPVYDAIRIARTDDEAPDRAGGDGIPAFDWLPVEPGRAAHLRAEAWRRGLQLAAGGGRLRSYGLAPNGPKLALFDAFARDNLRRALELLGRGSVVVTDRLHGHILCMMLGQPHVLVDDRFGKVSSFHAQWSSGLASARVVGSEADVPGAVAEVLAA